MSQWTYKPKKSGIRALMKSDGMRAVVGAKAEEIASSARAMAAEPGAVYASRTGIGKMSAHGYAYTANGKAMRDNARNDTLDRALGGAR